MLKHNFVGHKKGNNDHVPMKTGMYIYTTTPQGNESGRYITLIG